MKNIFAIVISTLALTAFAADAPGPKKPCKEGQTGRWLPRCEEGGEEASGEKGRRKACR